MNRTKIGPSKQGHASELLVQTGGPAIHDTTHSAAGLPLGGTACRGVVGQARLIAAAGGRRLPDFDAVRHGWEGTPRARRADVFAVAFRVLAETARGRGAPRRHHRHKSGSRV
jgi:hypothetical protein